MPRRSIDLSTRPVSGRASNVPFTGAFTRGAIPSGQSQLTQAVDCLGLASRSSSYVDGAPPQRSTSWLDAACSTQRGSASQLGQPSLQRGCTSAYSGETRSTSATGHTTQSLLPMSTAASRVASAASSRAQSVNPHRVATRTASSGPPGPSRATSPSGATLRQAAPGAPLPSEGDVRRWVGEELKSFQAELLLAVGSAVNDAIIVALRETVAAERPPVPAGPILPSAAMAALERVHHDADSLHLTSATLTRALYRLDEAVLAAANFSHASKNVRTPADVEPRPAATPPSPAAATKPQARVTKAKSKASKARSSPSHSRGPADIVASALAMMDTSRPRDEGPARTALPARPLPPGRGLTPATRPTAACRVERDAAFWDAMAESFDFSDVA
jgi:hypothetical protein